DQQIDPLAGPESVFGIGCDSLLSPASVAGALATPVSAIDAGVADMNSSLRISRTFAVESLGGLACEWNNGQPNDLYPGGTNPAYIGVQVLVLPNAGSQWARFEAYYSGSGAVGMSCATHLTPTYCELNQLVGTSWVQATISGASEATAAALGAEAVAAVSAAGPGAAPWAPPAGTLALPATCEGLVATATVQSALGVSTTLVASTDGGGWSLWAGARENWGGPRCNWLYEFSDSGVGFLASLPGGAWAWNEVRSAITFPTAPTSAAVAGLAPGDEAWVRCVASDGSCVVDLVIGGNWIEVRMWSDVADPRGGALAVAAAIVATLTP
ncbi:MAG: hypothetical protein ABL886_12695, partial [Rhodoglobus sp.]